MAETNPSLMPGQTPGASVAAVSNQPTAMPPAAVARADNGCGCNGASASGATAAGAFAAGGGSASTAPSLRPASAGAGGATATWQSNVHVAGLWSINQDRNCWTYLDTVGWRRLSEASESGLVAMNMLASHAYQLNATASLYEADDGRIAQLYVW